MKRNKLLIAILIGVIMLGDVECRKNTKSSGSRRSSVRTTPRPRSTTTRHDPAVNPNKIGWAIPEAGTNNRHNGGSVGPKPSAPLPDQHVATKTSASSVQSGYPGQSNQNSYQPNYNGQNHGHGYNPSVGQGYNPPAGQGYNPPVGQGYNPPYNPSMGQSYHPPGGQAYNPGMGQPYHQPYNPSVGQSYNPPVGQPYQQPIGQPYNPPVGQTVILAPAQGSAPSRGLGQIAKEAVVFAGVSAGVNAAVNRLLPGGSRGGGSSSTNTQITYNNYYNNQTDSQGNPMPPAGTGEMNGAAKGPEMSASPAPGSPMGAQIASAPENQKTELNPNSERPLTVTPLNADAPKSGQESGGPVGQGSGNQMAPPAQTNLVSNEELVKLSEELFKADTNNAFKHITLKLQGQKTDDSVTDSATEPLLTVQPEALEIPTIAALRSLYDKYELDSKVAEKMTPEKREAETKLINAFFATDVMSKAMKFIADKGLIPNDEYEFKDALKRIWFSQYARENNIISSSGFENVFLAEKVYTEITGLHNWIYFNEQESASRANYLGYIKEAKLGSDAAIVKLRATLSDIVRPVTTIFVGTSPELEMALYTVCYYVRPNGACPVSAGSTPFTIFTSRISYFGKEILYAAYPEI